MGLELLPSVITSGWASGVNAYATVLVLGLISRFGGVEAIPSALGNSWVLGIAGTLFLMEAIADKVPYIDSIWDSIHTFVRPVIGAGLGYFLGQDAASVEQILATLGGGATALASHGVKSMTRLAINTSPEPASNITASTVEDVSVIGLVSLAILHPWVAASICLALLIAGGVLVWYLLKRIREYRERRRKRKPAVTDVLRGRVTLADPPVTDGGDTTRRTTR